MKRISSVVLLLTIIGLTSHTAQAQMSDPLTGSTVDYGTWSNSNAMMNMMNNYFAYPVIGAGKGRGGRNAKSSLTPEQQVIVSRGEKVIAAGRATTQFNSLGSTLLPDVVAKSFTGANRALARETVSKGLSIYKQGLKSENLPENDLAVALAAFADTGRQVVLGQSELTPEQFKSLVSNFEQKILESKYVQGLTDRDKQIFYEKIAYNTVYYAAVIEQAKSNNDNRALQSARAGIEKAFNTYVGSPLSDVVVEGSNAYVR